LDFLTQIARISIASVRPAIAFVAFLGVPDAVLAGDCGYSVVHGWPSLPDDEFEFQWGHKGSGQGEFDLPHGLAINDSGRLYVADRSNSRVQVFNREGSFVSEWTRSKVGQPYGIAVDLAN
jgi:DNA-binding beta-propeller fold protein YncE